MIVVHCSCGAQMQLGLEWAGKQGKCPVCGAVLRIPSGDLSAPPIQTPAIPPVQTPPKSSPSIPAPSASTVLRPPARPTAAPFSTPPVQTAASSFSAPPVQVTPVKRVEPSAVLTRSAVIPPPATTPSAVVSAYREKQPPWLLIGFAGAAALMLLLGAVFALTSGPDEDPAVAVNVPENPPKTRPPKKTPNQPKVEPTPPGNPSSTSPVRNTPTTSLDPPPTTPEEELPIVPVRSTPVEEPMDPPTNRVETHTTPTKTKTPGNPPNKGPSQGLTGISTQYDDLRCRQIQARHGVRIPAAAEMLEVDGLRLPLANPGALAQAQAPVLLLPRGVHAVRFRAGDFPVMVTIAGDFAQEYQSMRRFFDAAGDDRARELLSRGARAMDVHGAPFLLNFAAGGHAANNRLQAAERTFRRSLSVNPTFAPAHLNLAECLLRRGQVDAAARETALADAFNVGNVYGLSAAVTDVRRRVEAAASEAGPNSQAGPVQASPTGDWTVDLGEYAGAEPTSEEDQRVAAVLESLAKYAVKAEDRAKIRNNIGAHYADVGKPERALHHYRTALSELKSAGPERFALARQVLSHMAAACRTAGFDEAAEYELMQTLVSP